MSNIIGFPREYLVIESGQARHRIENKNGMGPWSDPQFEYRIEWRETGGRAIIWTGSSYDDAVLAASEWNLPIVDKTGGVQ